LPRSYPALEVEWLARPADEDVERLLAALDDAGPTAVENLLTGVRIFFATSDDRDRAIAVLETLGSSIVWSARSIPDEAWAERSQASLGAVSVGRIVVAPPWALEARRPILSGAGASTVVVVQPSMGFGTGHHASTRGCLRLLQEDFLPGCSVLDVGTGSGVLAIAAWRLGATRVLAVDVDPDAIASAAENVELNGAGAAVEIRALDAGRDAPLLTSVFDLVTANLTGAMLERFAAALAGWVHPRGSLVASGFQSDEEQSVARALAAAGLSVIDRVAEDDWVTVRAVSRQQKGQRAEGKGQR
jgi:ribosomal protein L11 methyltransferase